MLGLPIGTERSKVPSIPAQRPSEVVQKRTGGDDSGGNIIHAKSIERMDLEMG